MKPFQRLILSLLTGLLVCSLWRSPMWWGAVFSPLAEPLATVQEAQEEGLYLRWGQKVLRLKGLDLVLDLLGKRG